MSGRDDDRAHSRLRELLAERARTAASAQPHRLDHEIATLAADLGFAPEEVAALREVEVTAAGPPGLVGQFRIYRRPSTYLPFVFGVMLAAIVAQLGQPLIAAGGVGALALGWLVRGRFSVCRFAIDPQGRLSLGRHGQLDWYAVERVEFRFRRPWLAGNTVAGHAGTTAQIRLRYRDGGTVRLARGQLFQIKPRRRPAHLADLGGYLRQQASTAGMTVRRLRGSSHWLAVRDPLQATSRPT